MNRHDRNIRFFGQDGQAKLRASCVAIVGIGGLGTHVVQQLALLGVGELALIDDEELDGSNRNRYIGARRGDPIPGTQKVAIGERIVADIDPGIRVRTIPKQLRSVEAFAAIKAADWVFGCMDNEGSRLVLTELCSAYERNYIDIASDIFPGNPPTYGGQVCVSWDGNGCLVCLGLLDVAEAQRDLEDPEARKNREAIYGVDRKDLNEAGPSVVSINGIVASLAVTEFMVAVTGIRPPKRVLSYHGSMGRVSAPVDEPAPDCYYCKGIRGKGDNASLDGYLLGGDAMRNSRLEG